MLHAGFSHTTLSFKIPTKMYHSFNAPSDMRHRHCADVHTNTRLVQLMIILDMIPGNTKLAEPAQLNAIALMLSSS